MIEKALNSQTSAGTSFHDQTIVASLNSLRIAFGDPDSFTMSDDKSKVEWILQIEGTVFTIYDWKKPESPMFYPDKVIEWHIGSHEKLPNNLYQEIITAL